MGEKYIEQNLKLEQDQKAVGLKESQEELEKLLNKKNPKNKKGWKSRKWKAVLEKKIDTVLKNDPLKLREDVCNFAEEDTEENMEDNLCEPASEKNIGRIVDIVTDAKSDGKIKEIKLCISYPNIDQAEERKEAIEETYRIIVEIENHKKLLKSKKKIEKEGLVTDFDFAAAEEETNKNIEEEKGVIIENIDFLKELLASSEEKIKNLSKYIEFLGQKNKDKEIGLSKEEVERAGSKAEMEKERLTTEIKILEDEIKILKDKIEIFNKEDEIEKLENEVEILEGEKEE